MNRLEQSRLKMYDAVILCCTNNQDILSTVPALQTAYGNFVNTTTSIVAESRKRSQLTAGFALNKKQLRIVLSDKTNSVAAALKAYASANTDVKLGSSIDFNFSRLKRYKDKEFPGVCGNIADIAEANLATLAAFNITQASLTDLRSSISQFIDASSEPRGAVNQRAGYRTTVSELFATAETILKGQLDNLVSALPATNSGFKAEYESARVIVGPLRITTKMKGVITNRNNNLPLEGAVVTIVENGITATSDAKGKYTLKPLSAGTYSLRVTKLTFVTITTNDLEVKTGRATVVNVAMPLSIPE